MEATEKVHIVGIWGVRGIGKTTIARALFNRIAHEFEGSSFVANVRENSFTKKDICGLQQKMLEDILGEHHGYKIEDSDKGAEIIQERCCGKKVLLVLDDVSDVEQLEFLAATPAKWFGPGSRIIITTMDRDLLSAADEKYKPATLSGDQAVGLFSKYAFNKRSPPEGYEELSIRAIRCTGGLPLALKVLGSLLHGRPSDVWESALDRLVEIPIKEIYERPELCFNVVQTKKGRWTYDVFISFRGRDTLHSFVESLYTELVWNGIRVFKDEEMLGGGQTILEQHVKAIKESRFAVVVFSKNYANSSLCLEELSTIMECHDPMKVLPVFYHVEPSDVHNLSRDFAAAFETHERKFKGQMDKVNKWREALTAAANLPAKKISAANGDEAAVTSDISEELFEPHPGASMEHNLIAARRQINPSKLSTVQTEERVHDVFLSFRDEDTGNNFSDHLHAALVQEPISVFKHGYAGQTISEVAVTDIEGSRFAVVVFSKNYVNSVLCMEELSTIMECHRRSSQGVLLVFYHVHRSDMGQRVDALTAAINLSNFLGIPLNNTGESAFVSKIVQEILDYVEISERRIGKLRFYPDKEIGRGPSDRIVVLEGYYDTVPVAVKRIKKDLHNKEELKKILQKLTSNRHPNIVGYYGVGYGKDFVYVALELCICSLHELILSPTKPTVESQLTSEEKKSFKVGIPIRYPSPEMLKVMRDAVTGLAHLHEPEFIHGDLKPQKVFIHKDSSSKISAKVSAMGISKCLPADESFVTSATGYDSSGWQAREQLRNEPQITQAVDLFSLGCLLFFCITGGRHPFGDRMDERDTNIENDLPKNLSLVDDIPEASDLVSNLIQSDPKHRPSAAEVYHHPLFWDPKLRLEFFHDVSQHSDESKVSQALESIGTVDYDTEWRDKVDDRLLKKAKYDFHKVSELIRLIRNKVEHFMELPEDFRAQLGDVSTGLEAYFRVLFPNLLMKVYKVLFPFGEEEAWLKVYYKKTVVLT